MLQRSYNSAGAAEHTASNPAFLGSHASGRSLPALNSLQSGSGRGLQTGSGSDASKVDMWLRGSSARPLLLDTEEESVDLGEPWWLAGVLHGDHCCVTTLALSAA